MGRLCRLSTLVLALLLAIGTVRAQSSDPSLTPPPLPDIVTENARRFLQGLKRLVEQMPMFEAPRLTPEGDIILKRIKPATPLPDPERAGIAHEHDGVEL